MNKDMYLILGGITSVIASLTFMVSLLIFRYENWWVVLMITVVISVFVYILLLRVFDLPLHSFSNVERNEN